MFPFAGLRLLLPAIVPSWRFFDTVAASPRVDYALLADADDEAQWQAFRPRPAVLTVGAMLRRLVWNAQWNEDLFLVSLAERLIHDPDTATRAHSERELVVRVARHLSRQGAGAPLAQIRIRLVARGEDGERLGEQVVYCIDPFAIADGA
ncbi:MULTISPECIES: hypothetical protein [Sphingomonas]|jgi:hypothetical protein|uniref:hypothetical protein n=1 Tax=Sphingomonas TaxID=13687 RepID=UPI000834E821|nr:MULTISPECIES: hypothetical protein [Sphingomonas]MBY0300347.1 hypothetical protein [Sphingomonas ginsenosidimutans]